MLTKLNSLKNHQGFMKYFKNTSWLLGEKILRMVVGLFMGIWTARYLGPDAILISSIVLALGFLYFYLQNSLLIKNWKFIGSWLLLLNSIVIAVYMKIKQLITFTCKAFYYSIVLNTFSVIARNEAICQPVFVYKMKSS